MRTTPMLLTSVFLLISGCGTEADRDLSSQEDRSSGVINTAGEPPENPDIDYPGFVRYSASLEDLRASRRVPLDQFMEMAENPGTIILDTRSKAAYDAVHLEGAVHLNFSDFTAAKLESVIPLKQTRILIYCNNNFSTPKQVAEKNPHAVQSIARKSAPLALNIPTFINLQGYGYANVYELADSIDITDSRLALAGTQAQRLKKTKQHPLP